MTDEAAKCIAGFPLTNDNYEHSIALLRERFGQPQKIVNAHMQALLSLPNPSNNMTSLHSFHDSVENHIRGLTALRQSRDSYGTLLVPIILEKLPVETRRNLARDHPTFEWTIDEPRDAILREIRVFKAGVHITSQTLPDTMSMTATFHAGTQPPHHKVNIGGKDRVCVYCKGAHSTTNCNVITDHQKRVEHIKKEGLCFNCLARHRVAQCSSRKHCKQCNRKHHTSVCKAYLNRPSLTNTLPCNQSSQHTRPSVLETKLQPHPQFPQLRVPTNLHQSPQH